MAAIVAGTDIAVKRRTADADAIDADRRLIGDAAELELARIVRNG